MMLSLERAVRVFRALVESPVKVDSSTVASWPHLERALAHSPTLLTEIRALSEPMRARVQAYVREFTPLDESRPVYVFPGVREATKFIEEVNNTGGSASHVDGGGIVAATSHDYVQVEALAASLGGSQYRGPSLGEHFDYVDCQLPEALFIESGLDAQLCEQALLDAMRGTAKSLNLNESMLAGINTDGPLAAFQTRINTFVQPKMVLGVPKQIAEAVRLAGWATPAMRTVMEAGDPNAVAAGGGADDGGASDRGGTAKDQPDANNGSPANSRTSEQQPQQPPTEHVPSTEQGGASNSIKLPDGTEVPFDVMKQAFAKMLHNMATQVENGTMGGQPEPRGVDQADAAGGEGPQPSVAQQQVAAQSASQQAAGNGAEPQEQPAQATGEPAAPAGAPPADGAPPAPGAEVAAPAPGEPAAPAAPGAAPQGDPAVEDALVKAEAGDQEALKQAQGMQGQMTDEQKQRLQALIGGAAPAPTAESINETKYSQKARDVIDAEMSKQKGKGGTHSQKVGRAIGVAKSKGLKVPPRPSKNESVLQENLRDALRLMESTRERDLVAGISIIRESGVRNQPSKLVERVLDRLNVLAGHSSQPVREAAMAALGSLYESVTDESIVPTMLAYASATNTASYSGTSKGGGGKKDGEGIFSTIKGMLGGKQKDEMNMQEWHAEQQRRRDGMNAARKAYAKKQNESCTVWSLTDVVPAVLLPEGLSYQGGGCAPGDRVALVEEGTDTSLVRTPSGDTVRVANQYLQMEGGGFVNGELVESADLRQIIESAAGGNLILVVGAPHSGKGHFIKSVIGPCVLEGRNVPSHLVVSAPWRDIQERTAREDFEALLREAHGDETKFDRALMSPRFRYVVEDRHEFLRDIISWGEFKRCGAAAQRLGTTEGFQRYYGQPKVRQYYESMRSDTRSATSHVFRERANEAIIEMGNTLIVDCTPTTNLAEYIEHAVEHDMHAHLMEFITPLSMSLARSNKQRESVIRRAANAVGRSVDEAVRSGNVHQHTRFIWHGDEHVGRFTAVEGKIEKNQIVKSDVPDAEDPDDPKVRKDIVVRESWADTVEALIEEAGSVGADGIEEDIADLDAVLESGYGDEVEEGIGRFIAKARSKIKGAVTAASDKANQNNQSGAGLKGVWTAAKKGFKQGQRKTQKDIRRRDTINTYQQHRQTSAQQRAKRKASAGGGGHKAQQQAAQSAKARVGVRRAESVRESLNEALPFADVGDGQQWFVGEVVKPGRIMGQTRWFTVLASDQREAKLKIEMEFSRQENLPMNFPIKFKSIRPINNPRQGRGFIIEQLDTGQAAESESCASGIKEAGTLLSDARAALFKLTTSSLVQCASMAQATGMNKTKGILEKVQQQGAGFLDELKAMGDLLDKANEAMKAENGGMGGDNVDAVKQQAAAMAGNGDPAAAPVPDAAAPTIPAAPAAPAGAPVPEPVVGEAISKVLGTPFMEAIKRGDHYRELNESLVSYCPNLDVRQRTQVIDRLKAMSMLPEDARLRVGFSAVDHRLLSESAVFGSIAAGLVDRTRGNRQTLASPEELHETIKALRTRGGAMHSHLAETLERGLVQSRLSESRAEAKAWGDPFSDKGPFKLNVARISVDQALAHAESIYSRFGMNVSDDLPNLERNFKLLKAKMKYALPIARQEMPVIEPKKGDIDAFVRDLEAGHVDIFEPWAAEHIHNLFPWERSGKPPLRLGDDDWITLGMKDGNPTDDKLPVGKVRSISVQKLKPLQDQIWFDKLIATIIAFGPPGPGSFVTTKGVAIVSSDDYILDGHHRFGQIYLADPSLPMQGLVVPLKRDKLLDITRSYGTARGNKSKA